MTLSLFSPQLLTAPWIAALPSGLPAREKQGTSCHLVTTAGILSVQSLGDDDCIWLGPGEWSLQVTAGGWQRVFIVGICHFYFVAIMSTLNS